MRLFYPIDILTVIDGIGDFYLRIPKYWVYEYGI